MEQVSQVSLLLWCRQTVGKATIQGFSAHFLTVLAVFSLRERVKYVL